MMAKVQRRKAGELVVKDGGDYSFRGWVLVRYPKRSGAERYVVENLDGLNFIMHGSALRSMTDSEQIVFLNQAVATEGTSVGDSARRLAAEIDLRNLSERLSGRSKPCKRKTTASEGRRR